MPSETPQRIEPALLDTISGDIADLIAEISAASARLGQALHPSTAANLADLVRLTNTFYSNLIEGHNTRPRDIEAALEGHLSADRERRNLQREAAAHVRVQRQIDMQAAADELPEPASIDFLKWLHREFYHGAPPEMLRIEGAGRNFQMRPGAWRSRDEHDVTVGRHQPPASNRVTDFMEYFARRYRFTGIGASARILVIPAAHHRFNYIHPFPDGNGRVSRLMSHAMAHKAGIAANGLWSISRGLARGLESRGDYKRMMDHADTPRQGDRDGRGNLSERALHDFVVWFLKVCLDQIRFMSGLFELDMLAKRLRKYVDDKSDLKPETTRLLEEALIRGQFERGEVERIAGLPERTARRVLTQALEAGRLASETPKGPVSLRFPADTLDTLFPRLFPEI